MKYVPTIAGILLGLLFLFAGGAYFAMTYFGVAGPQPTEPPPAQAAAFMGAMMSTGYLEFVKALEVIGGLLVAIPRTRNLGLLVLGPIILNILCVSFYLMGGFQTLLDPMLIAISALALYLLWVERRAFGALINRPAAS